jgi:hypothetical protein
MLKNIDQFIHIFTGLENGTDYIKYNSDTDVFEILFDGKPEHQVQILHALIDHQVPVLEFSVPKAGLLEDIYLKFIEEASDQAEHQILSKNQRHKRNPVPISTEVK